MHVADLCLHLLAHSLPGCLEGFPLLRCLVTRVKARPRIAAYLASERYACTDTCLYRFLPSFPPSLLPSFPPYVRPSFLLPYLLTYLLTYYNFLIHHSPDSQVRQH